MKKISLSYNKNKGFIDLHTHGFGGYDTKTNDPYDILRIAELHGKTGTAAILPTIYSGTVDKMRNNIEAVRKAMEMQRSTTPHPPLTKGGRRGGAYTSRILGVHLEGPFLNPVRSGALDQGFFIRPSVSSLKRLIDGYEDIIRIITIAPEMPGALRVIEKCFDTGIRVNMGHSDATFKEAEDGKRAGATGITHIFNAMRPFHHREPGLAGFGLLDDDIYIEVIADGIHLHRETLKLVFHTKPLDKIILISDSVKRAMKRGKPIYRGKGILAGSGMSIAGSVWALNKIGIYGAGIIRTGIQNPKKYLGSL